MPFAVTCPFCSHGIAVADRDAGHTIKCPLCGGALVTPPLVLAPPVAETAHPAAGVPVMEAAAFTPSPRHRRRGSNASLWLCIVFLSAIVAGGIGLWFGSTKGAREDRGRETTFRCLSPTLKWQNPLRKQPNPSLQIIAIRFLPNLTFTIKLQFQFQRSIRNRNRNMSDGLVHKKKNSNRVLIY